MNWDQIEGKWKQMKGTVRQKWGKLTDDDLDVIVGLAGPVGWKDPGGLRNFKGRSLRANPRMVGNGAGC